MVALEAVVAAGAVAAASAVEVAEEDVAAVAAVVAIDTHSLINGYSSLKKLFLRISFPCFHDVRDTEATRISMLR